MQGKTDKIILRDKISLQIREMQYSIAKSQELGWLVVTKQLRLSLAALENAYDDARVDILTTPGNEDAR